MSDKTTDEFPTERYEGADRPYIKPALGLGATGVPKDTSYPDVFHCTSKECGAMSCRQELEAGACACGASVRAVHDVSRDQYRAFLKAQNTIAAQSVEIERLRAEGITSHKHENELIESNEGLRADLATAEKEVAHMRESNGRADDYSAKLEAERDELRAEVARLRDRLLDSLAAGVRPDDVDRGMYAVILAQAEMIAAQESHAVASTRLAAIYAKAGLAFEVRDAADVPGLSAEPTIPGAQGLATPSDGEK